MRSSEKTDVVVTARNSTSFTLGLFSLILGTVGLLLSWIPYLGLFALPVAGVGILLAGIGMVIAVFKRFSGFGFPIVGAAICALAIGVAIVTTTTTVEVINEAMDAHADDESASDDTPEQERAKGEYIKEQLELYEVSGTYRESLLDGRVPGVTFKLRNKGTRQLDKVKVTVFFKDSAGSIIYEEDYNPVSVSAWTLTGDNKPLKPGYVWQIERGKFFSAKSVPSEWKEGSIAAEVTEIEFSK